MEPKDRRKMYSDELFESLLLDMRSATPEEPLHPAVDDLTRRRMVSSVLAEWDDQVRSQQVAKLSTVKMLAIAAVAAMSLSAMLLGVFLLLKDDTSSATAAVASTNSAMVDLLEVVPQSRFSLLHGDVDCGSSAVKLGAKVPMEQWIETRQGQSAFALPTGIAVGLANNSAVRVFWNGKRRYEVEINQGMALFSVDPAKSREGFFVRTPKGSIEVTGTLFTVVVRDDGDVSVHLHRGKVEIHTKGRVTQHVGSGSTALLGSDAIEVLDSKVDLGVTHQLHRLGCIDAGQIFSELTGKDCNGDTATSGQELGQSDDATGNWKKGKATAKVHPIKVSDLLKAGRQARMEKKWKEAAAAYRILISDYPKSADSKTALVTLAQIELRKLHSPKAALVHFNTYLTAPGALEQEALYGKAKAYRQMNKMSNELKTLNQLIVKYPTGPISQAANLRIAELSQSR